MSSRTFFFCGH